MKKKAFENTLQIMVSARTLLAFTVHASRYAALKRACLQSGNRLEVTHAHLLNSRSFRPINVRLFPVGAKAAFWDSDGMALSARCRDNGE